MTAQRLLLLPNEHVEGQQIGPRLALAAAVRDGLFEAAESYSLLALKERGETPTSISAGLREVLADLRPTVVLLLHPAGSGLNRSHIEMLRQWGDRVVIGYHEADPYCRIRQPLPREARLAARSADVVWTVGTGTFSTLMRRHGATDVRYSGHRRDESRFPPQASPLGPQAGKVVVIGNRSAPLKPWRKLPGAKAREHFVEGLAKDHGEDLTVFGRGWKMTDAHISTCRYEDQAEQIRKFWVSANWDHFPREPGYYSDRLPISLSAGVPHVTTWHPGLEHLFPQAAEHGLFLERSVRDARLRVRHVLELPESRRRLLGDRAADLSRPLGQAAEYARLFEELISHRVSRTPEAHDRSQRSRRPS